MALNRATVAPMNRIVLAAALLVSCGKDSGSAASSGQATRAAETKPTPPSGDQARVDAALKLARTNLPMIEKALAEHNSTTAMFECPETLKVLSDVAAGDKALADKIAQLCNHDIYAAEIKAEVAAIEAERAANPDKRRLDGCYQLRAAMAGKKMAEAKTLDPEAQALLDKRVTLCVDPKAKK